MASTILGCRGLLSVEIEKNVGRVVDYMKSRAPPVWVIRYGRYAQVGAVYTVQWHGCIMLSLVLRRVVGVFQRIGQQMHAEVSEVAYLAPASHVDRRGDGSRYMKFCLWSFRYLPVFLWYSSNLNPETYWYSYYYSLSSLSLLLFSFLGFYFQGFVVFLSSGRT